MYDFDRSPPVNPGHFPPQYLAWWKPPSTYFPPRCEAPPPYEEAISSTSNTVPSSFLARTMVNEAINTTILTNENINRRSEGQIFPSAPPPDFIQETTFSTPSSSSVSGSNLTEEVVADQATPGPSSRLTLNNTGVADDSGEVNETEEGVESKDLLPSYNEVSLSAGRDCFRHSLTLPRRPNLEEMREFGLDLEGSNYSRNAQQRLSLQLNVADWSSSSSTISLSMSTPTMGCRNPSLTSSSSSSSNNTNDN
jgi:hypothetical protein